MQVPFEAAKNRRLHARTARLRPVSLCERTAACLCSAACRKAHAAHAALAPSEGPLLMKRASMPR